MLRVLACLYDVHGNLAALDAVLVDARERGADRFLLGGDYCLFGPQPAETLARLRELPSATWIRGNGERWTAQPEDAPDNDIVPGAIAACREALGEAAITELAALAFDAVIDGTRFVHASPVSDVRPILPQSADDEPELLDGVAERRLVFGHTHLPFSRISEQGIELINPGSVGLPFDGDPRAAYALIEADGSIVHRRVAYDHERAAEELRVRFEGDWVAPAAARLESARMG